MILERGALVPSPACARGVERKLRRNSESISVVASIVVHHGAATAAYQRRHAEELLLRRLVAAHLDEFLVEARAQHDTPLPLYVGVRWKPMVK